MESYLFADVEAAADTMVVEGYHKPGSLTPVSYTHLTLPTILRV